MKIKGGGEIGREDILKAFGRWYLFWLQDILFIRDPWVVRNIPFWAQKLFSSLCCVSPVKILKYTDRKLELRKMQEEYKWDNFMSVKMVTGDKAWSYSIVQLRVTLCDSRSPQWVNRKKTVPQKIYISSSWIWIRKKKESSLL